MTITMVKAGPARSLIASAIAAALAAPAAQAEWRFTPSAGVRESWTDNVNLAPEGQEKSQLVTTVSPGFTLTNETPRLRLTADYHFNAYLYAGGHPDNTSTSSQNLRANAKAKLVGEELFLDADANVSQVATSGFGPQVTPDSGFIATNRNEIRTIRVSPYFVHTFGSLANMVLRYQYDRVTSDNAGFGQSNSNSLTAALGSGSSFRKVGWDLSTSYQSLDDNIAGHTNTFNGNLGLRYLMSPDFSLTASGGYDSYDYETQGRSTKGAAYTVGFQWTPSGRTSITANAGHRFYGPSYFLSAQHRSRSTVWSISYNDAVSNTRNQFSLPQTLNTASLLDQLFAATIPDPVQRAAAVKAYIAATGLPSALPNATNYLSNRFELTRQFQATMTGTLAKASLLAGVYRTKREAVSNTSADSALLGNQNFGQNDNTDQVGANVALSYKMGPRTQATLTASAYKVESLTTERNQMTRQLSFYLSRQFSAKLSGVAELRHTRGGTLAAADSKYTENAVAVGLAMQF